MTDLAQPLTTFLQHLTHGPLDPAAAERLRQAYRQHALSLGERSVVLGGAVTDSAGIGGVARMDLDLGAWQCLLGILFPPALRSLRAPAADFAGRQQEAHQLLAHLARRGGAAALITGVNALEGVGKTELALCLARQLESTYPDVQLLLDLQPGGRLPALRPGPGSGWVPGRPAG
jgi:hypothetical protein